MSADKLEDTVAEWPSAAAVPLHARLTQKQRRALIFLAFAVPFWVILSLLSMADRTLTMLFLGGLLFLFIMYGMRLQYLLFLWLALIEYDLLVKAMGASLFGIGLKGMFMAAVLSQLPNKFALMPRKLFRTVPARWPLYLFMLWAGASLFWTEFPRHGFRTYLRHLTTLFVFAIAYLTINDRNKRLFYIVFALVFGPSILFGLLQAFGLSVALPDIDLLTPQEFGIGTGKTVFRATGFAGHPNAFGRECVLFFLVLLMMLIFWRPRAFWRAAIVGMLALTLATIVITYSRAAWAYLAIGGTVFLLTTRPRWIVLLLAAAVLVLVLAWPQVWARLEPLVSGTDISLQSRTIARVVYLEHWKARPLTGYGIGSSGGGALFETGLTPHEGYTYLLSFFGLVGFSLYVLVFLGLAVRAVKGLRDRYVRTDPELRAMAALAVAIIAIISTNFLYRSLFHAATYYLLGASLGAMRIARNRFAAAASQSPPKGPPNNARPGSAD